MRARRVAKVVLCTLGGAYLVVASFFFAVQRRLLFPAPAPRTPDLGALQLLTVGHAHAIWLPGPPQAPVIAHFHGNAEQLDDLGGLAHRWHDAGFGFLAVEYPGYGASADRAPDEDALYDDAEAALAFLRESLHVPPDDTVLEGRSLGTGVATELALRGRGTKLLLISPYTSIPDVAAEGVPFLPARLLVRDRFDSASKAPHIEIPVLVLHGRHDAVVPFALGEKLAELFPHARLLALEAGHDDLLARPDAWTAAVDFARGSPR